MVYRCFINIFLMFHAEYYEKWAKRPRRRGKKGEKKQVGQQQGQLGKITVFFWGVGGGDKKTRSFSWKCRTFSKKRWTFSEKSPTFFVLSPSFFFLELRWNNPLVWRLWKQKVQNPCNVRAWYACARNSLLCLHRLWKLSQWGCVVN